MVELMIKMNMIDDVKEFVRETLKIDADIDLVKGRYVIDAKSMIGVFTIDFTTPVKLCIHSDNASLLEPFRKWEVK